MTVEYDFTKPICGHCHKKVATLLCDMPIDIVITTETGVPIRRYITCDKYLCEECAKTLSPYKKFCNTHFCPKCAEILAETLKK